MPRFNRPCIDCGTITKGTRCEKCTAALPPRPIPQHRREQKRLLYNHNYRKRRAALLATATHCALCHKPFQYGEKIEADHLYPGDPSSPLQATHRTCNLRKSNKQPENPST